MSHVIVLAGGTSAEREVSLRSGEAVSAALREAGHQVEQLDPTVGLEQLLPRLQAADVVFPALHGLGGEDGSLQAFLEKQHIAYVGNDSEVCAVTFYKDRYYQVLQRNDIPTPETELVSYAQFQHSPLTHQPYVLKPNDGGSSIDTLLVRDIAQSDPTTIKALFARHGTIILQQLITGTEVTVAILGDTVLPVIEIIPPTDQEFDYENKYNGVTKELCPPEHVDLALQHAAQAMAQKAHRTSGCRDLSRTDIIITPDGKLYMLEINTIPGLTTQSLLPKAARTAGVTMSQLCDQLVQSALARN